MRASCGIGQSCVKSHLHVRAWGHPEDSLEGACQVALVTEPTEVGGRRCRLTPNQQFSRPMRAYLREVRVRRKPVHVMKASYQVIGAQAALPRQHRELDRL